MLLMYIFTHITKLQKIEAELRGIKPTEIKFREMINNIIPIFNFLEFLMIQYSHNQIICSKFCCVIKINIAT